MTDRVYYAHCGINLEVRVVTKPGFLGFGKETQKKFVQLCFYEENNRIYEFFSGKEVLPSQKVYPSYYTPVYAFKDDPDVELSIGNKVTAVYFADYVKPWMPYKVQIAEAVEKFIQDSKRKRMEEEKRKIAQEKEDQEKETWLDSVLKNR